MRREKEEGRTCKGDDGETNAIDCDAAALIGVG